MEPKYYVTLPQEAAELNQKHVTRHMITRGLVGGLMKWKIVDPKTQEMVAYSETYQGAQDAIKEIQSPFDDPIVKLRESGINYDLLGQIVAEKARLRDSV